MQGSLKHLYDTRSLFYFWPTISGILAGKNPAPLCMDIDLSNLCNHDCIWCHSKEVRKHQPERLSEPLIHKLLHSLAELGCKSVIYSGGGEPLTNKSVSKAINIANEVGLKVALVTNGGLLNEEVAAEAVKRCSWIRVSLDAGSAKTHKNLHRPRSGHFQEVIANVSKLANHRRKLGKKNPTIGVSFLIHPENVSEIFSAGKQVKSAGADYIYYRSAAMSGISFAAFEERIKDQQDKAIDKLGDDDFTVIGAKTETIRTEIIQTSKEYNRCLGHRIAGVVGASSDVYLCCMYRKEDWSFGRLPGNPAALKRMSAKDFWYEVWGNERRQTVIDKIDVKKCPPCKQDRYNALLWRLYQKPKERKIVDDFVNSIKGVRTNLSFSNVLKELTDQDAKAWELIKWISEFFTQYGVMPFSDHAYFL